MKFPRRQFLHLLGAAAALPVVSRVAMAQAYPTRPVRVIIGYPPGGSADGSRCEREQPEDVLNPWA
ncbi:MAG: hypothetical protein WBE42_20515, partial [Pseudolabrys sp.]